MKELLTVFVYVYDVKYWTLQRKCPVFAKMCGKATPFQNKVSKLYPKGSLTEGRNSRRKRKAGTHLVSLEFLVGDSAPFSRYLKY